MTYRRPARSSSATQRPHPYRRFDRLMGAGSLLVLAATIPALLTAFGASPEVGVAEAARATWAEPSDHTSGPDAGERSSLTPALPAPDPSVPPLPLVSPSPSPSPSPSASSPAGPTYPIPSTIDGTCVSDATQRIRGWIASVPDGSTLVFGANACYRVEGSLIIQDRNGLTFDGNGATIRATTRGQLTGCCDAQGRPYYSQRRHLWFRGSHDITVRDLRVRGTNTTADQRSGFGSYDRRYEFEHAFAFEGCRNVLLQDVRADAIWGDGLYLGPLAGDPSDGVRVLGFDVDRNGRQGVALSGAQNVLLDDVRVLHGRRAGFDLEPPPGWVRNVEISNSYTNTIGLAFAAGGRGDVSNIYIHHNTIDGPSVPWVYVQASDGTRRRDWRVWDNTVLRTLGSPQAALLFTAVDGVDVRRNISRIATTQSRMAVRFKDARGTLVVVDNDFSGACRPYAADAATAPVIARGNKTSSC